MEYNNSSSFSNFSSTLTKENLTPLEWNLIRTLQSFMFGSVVSGTIIGNFLAIYAFLKYHQYLRSPTHFFLANLALADLLVGILSLPFLAVFSVTLRWYFGHHFCQIWTMLHFWFCSCSILSTLAVCAERFVGVRYPLQHLRIMNRRRILMVVGGVWLLAGVLGALPLFVWPETPSEKALDCKINLRLGHVVVASVGIFHLPATAMGLLYYLIYRTAIVPMKDSNRQNLEEQRKKEVRLSKKLSLLVGFLIISYLPMFTVFLILGFNPNFCPLEVFVLLAWLRYFNSFVNPFIYAFSVPGYKKAFKSMFSWRGYGFKQNIPFSSKSPAATNEVISSE